MGFVECSVKYLLFLFNVCVVVPEDGSGSPVGEKSLMTETVFTLRNVAFLCGVVVMVLGVLTNSYVFSLKTILEGQITATSIALIVIGAVVFIIAFLGCCGAIRESYCMVQTYAVFLLTILIIEIAVGALVFVYRVQFEDKFKEGLSLTFAGYNADQDETETVDTIQKEFKCCGTDGPSSWVSKLPQSCCKDPDSSRDDCHPYPDGCVEKVTSQLKEWLSKLGGLAIGVACIEVFGVIFACFLARSIHKRPLSQNYY